MKITRKALLNNSYMSHILITFDDELVDKLLYAVNEYHGGHLRSLYEHVFLTYFSGFEDTHKNNHMICSQGQSGQEARLKRSFNEYRDEFFGAILKYKEILEAMERRYASGEEYSLRDKHHDLRSLEQCCRNFENAIEDMWSTFMPYGVFIDVKVKLIVSEDSFLSKLKLCKLLK